MWKNRGGSTFRFTLFGLFILTLAVGLPGQESGGNSAPPTLPGFTGEAVLRSFRSAYPERVEAVAMRGGDWAARIGDRWFTWSDGRLLPEGEISDPHRFHPYPFYRYRSAMPALRRFSPEETALLKNRLTEREATPRRRHPGFFDALWRIDGPQSADAMAKTTWFLGRKTLIHRELLEDLAAVEEEILTAMKTDAELRNFVESLESVAGFGWRPIAGTESRSFHSYGAAIDLIPRDYGGRYAYWRWARDVEGEWWTIPYERRWPVPEKLIAAFERRGFVWGGKWFFFDQIHFEYRPEILAVNGFVPEK